jgi:hypothetical protein
MMNPIGVRNEHRVSSRDPSVEDRTTVVLVPEHGGAGPGGTRVRRSRWPGWRSATGRSCGPRAPAGSRWTSPSAATGSARTPPAPPPSAPPSQAPHHLPVGPTGSPTRPRCRSREPKPRFQLRAVKAEAGVSRSRGSAVKEAPGSSTARRTPQAVSAGCVVREERPSETRADGLPVRVGRLRTALRFRPTILGRLAGSWGGRFSNLSGLDRCCARGGGRWRRGRACISCRSRRGRVGCGRPSCRIGVGVGWRRRAPRLR